LELFKPFVLREILVEGLAPNVKSAKHILESREPEVWDILEKLVSDHPVLLNRAPTLHRLGIQAFMPKLIEGNAIQIHPCVCPGYNADFDGDQMAVHLPLSKESKEESLELMLSTKNLRKPASGNPVTIPDREMLVGLYYLTSYSNEEITQKSVYSSPEEALAAYYLDIISLKEKIKVMIDNKVIETSVGRIKLNSILPESLRYFNDETSKKNGAVNNLVEDCISEEGEVRTAQLVDDLKNLGFKYATVSGISMGINDIRMSDERDRIIGEADKKASEIDTNLRRGLITKVEKSRLSQGVWVEATNELDELTWDKLDKFGPIRMMVESGARGSREQVKQMGGMRGLIADPLGRIVELPIRSNYRVGLTGFEYFAGSSGARKGITDKSLKTADSGYLTRRLVDVAQEAIIRREDCGASDGRTLDVEEKTALTTFYDRIYGRVATNHIKAGRKILVKKGAVIDSDKVEAIRNAKVSQVEVRSPLTCESRYGLCAMCYGIDMMTQKLVEVGSAVGVIAAQSIGEPGTQLTMRTFHTGGIVGKDITQGLPRVEELFEARKPKNASLVSEIAGRVKVEEEKDTRKIVIKPTSKSEEVEEVEYMLDPTSELKVKNGDLVSAGDALTLGDLDLSELLAAKGLRKTQKYILNDVLDVYSSQGVSLNDKHVEIIIRQMFSKVTIESVGDTKFLPGEIVSKYIFEDENEKILAEGGEPAVSKVTLLGITRASLETDSFLAAASFMETSRVLTDSALSGSEDKLIGLKENVIIGRPIPTGERARME